MATMHSLYYQAVDTMDLAHVNHFERQGVLPIAFSLFHYTNMQDSTFMVMSGKAPTWNDEWQSRVRMAIDDHGKERSVEEMVDQRIGDYEAFKAYQRTVFDRTEAWITTLDLEMLQRVFLARPFPEVVAKHLQRPLRGARRNHPAGRHRVLAPPARPPPHRRDRVARGLVGLGGMTS